MSIKTKRAAIATIATLAAAMCGALAGSVLGRLLVLRHMDKKLDEFALRIRREGETSAAESRAMLATLNASAYPYCSEAEMAWVRKLIFKAEFLNDAGHMREGRIDCSATLGRQTQPGPQYAPEFSKPDGTHVYLNLAPLQMSGHSIVSIQKGSAFAVYSPFNLKSLESSSMHFTVNEVDAVTGQPGRLVGESPHAPARVLTTEGHAQQDGTIYVTRCSTRYTSCMTAFVPISEAFQANRGELRAYIGLSGLCGGLLGFAWSLLYLRSLTMEQQLRRAIRKGKLRVVYQPIVELASRRIVAAEALARWSDDDNRAVGPDVFVRVAEERGFVGAITKLMVRRVLSECGETLRKPAEFRINVNIAAADLGDAQFLPMLDQALDEAGVKAERLGIEVTESYTARHQVAKEAILHLRNKGHKVHIDDFGTGYSSLAYLHDLSVDGIKIDRAFTKAIGTEAVTVSIIPQILAMASALKLQITAEGIETEEQAGYFAASGQNVLAQGWFFGRPAAAEEFHRLLGEEERKAAARADGVPEKR
jgi:sensor c-di-GMP phosphodiesterase-like protein